MDDLDKLVLVAILDFFDRLPGIVLDLLALFPILLLQQFFLPLQTPDLFVFGLFLEGVLDAQFLDIFLLN